MGQSQPDEFGSELRVALIVEDDADVRNLASAVLEESDLSVIACASAEAALAILERPGVTVALLFTDVRLAGSMDGLALAQAVKRRWPSVRVVLTSGYGVASSDRLPNQVVYLQKPWSALDVLVEAEHAFVATKAA